MLDRLWEQKRVIVYFSSDINLPLELNASQTDLMENLFTFLKIFDDTTCN